MRRLLLASLVLLSASRAVGAAPTVSRAQLTAIYRQDDIDNVTMAPDGKHLAYTTRDKGKLVLTVLPLDRTLSGKFSIPFQGASDTQWLGSSALVYALGTDIRVVDVITAQSRVLADDHTFAYYDMGHEVARRLKIVGVLRGGNKVIVITPAATGAIAETYAIGLDGAAPEKLGYMGVGPGASVLGHETLIVLDALGRPRLVEPPAFMSAGNYIGPNGIEPDYMMFPEIVEFSNMDGIRRDLDNYLDPDSGPLYDLERSVGRLAGTTDTIFKFTVDEYFGPRTLALGFAADPNLLFVASNRGRDRYGIYQYDLTTKRRTDFAIEDELRDLADPGDSLNSSLLVLDHSKELVGIRQRDPLEPVRWLDPGLSRVQSTVESELPDRAVEILGWSEDRKRYLLLATGSTEPGRYFVYEPESDALRDYLRRAPGYPVSLSNLTIPFSIATEAVPQLTGRLTLPQRPLISPAPVIVYCRDFPADAPRTVYDPDAQVLAAMGFAVLEVDHRGVAGFGAAHRDAIQHGVDTIPLEDIRAAIYWAQDNYKLNRVLVGFVGEGLGGFLGLRALELYPDEFRCTVAINAPADLGAWVDSSHIVNDMALMAKRRFLSRIDGVGGFAGIRGLGGLSAVRQIDRIATPVMLLQDTRKPGLGAGGTAKLRDALRRAGAAVEYKTLSPAFEKGVPETRAAVFEDIGGFLRTSFLEFNVKIGQPRVVK